MGNARIPEPQRDQIRLRGFGRQWDAAGTGLPSLPTMADFTTLRRHRIPGIPDPEDASDASVTALVSSLEAKYALLKDTNLSNHILSALKEIPFTKVRCVALGSPSQEEPALYQLALLRLIAENQHIKSRHISLYDPVFTALDIALFRRLDYIVEEEYTPTEKDDCLYFLPHAPLNLTNTVLLQEPKFFLSNNAVRHTERLAKAELHAKYPLLSKLVHILEPSTASVPGDGFTPVVRRRHRKNKAKLIDTNINYDEIRSYFSSAAMTSFKEWEEGPWLNAFTDLALHVIG